MSELPDLYVRNSKGEPIKNLQSDLSRFLVVGGADAMATEFQKKAASKVETLEALSGSVWIF